MARSKSEHFSDHQIDLARFAAAMGHPARIAIVGLLLEYGERCCGEIAEHLPLAQATVSQHLRALREAGVIVAEECGPKVCYRLQRERIGSFCEAMQTTLGNTPSLNGVAGGRQPSRSKPRLRRPRSHPYR